MTSRCRRRRRCYSSLIPSLRASERASSLFEKIVRSHARAARDRNHSRVFSRLTSLAIIGELYRRLENALLIDRKTMKHVIANLPLVTLVITKLTRLRVLVRMKVRFKAKVIRCFSLPRCFPTRSCTPVSRVSLISRVIFP